MRSCRFLCFWILACSLCVISQGQSASDHSPNSNATQVHALAPSISPPVGWVSHLLNLRKRVAGKGISESLLVTNDWSFDVRGGSHPGAKIERCLIDASVGLDMHKLVGWSGGSALVRLHSYQGENGSAQVGDAQGFSNIDDVSHTLLYELWLEQKIPDTHWRARAGKIDANTLFATVESGTEFLNSSMGHSPTILKLPTYPEPRLGGNVLYDNSRFNAQLGIYNTAVSGSLMLFEGGYRFSIGNDSHTRSTVGLWHLRSKLPSYDSWPHTFTTGFYTVQELDVRWQNTAPGHREHRLMAFVQYGFADPTVSAFWEHTGGGIVWLYPFGRNDDSIGAGVALVILGQCPGASFDYRAEESFEFYYKLRINRFVSVSPDTQFIRFSGGTTRHSDPVVFTPRITVSF